VNDVDRGKVIYLTVELLRTAHGRLEGVVATESGRERTFSGDLLRILADLQPPAAPSSGDVPTPRWPR
jgi:hypothetical protein